MLTLRLIGVRDYSVHDDGQQIGRIRFASERSPGVWLWHVQIHIPDDAKRHFRANWLAFKAKHGPQALAAAYRAMSLRDEP